MGNAVIIIVLVAVVGLAVYSTVRRIRFGSACCGERDAAPKKVKVQDRNKRHYPYTFILSIDGMHCSNCARRIENAYNSGDGRWARANIEKKEVTLLSKRDESGSELGHIASEAGYTMLSCRKL